MFFTAKRTNLLHKSVNYGKKVLWHCSLLESKGRIFEVAAIGPISITVVVPFDLGSQDF
jgi:hypothetical protein